MTRSHALVLTGEVLPGFEPASVWQQLAVHFRIAPDKMAQVLARTPRTIKQDGDLDKLRGLQAGIARIGAQTEICPLDERPALHVMIDGAPRGPMPRALVQRRIEQGQWADSISVQEAGASEWKPYREWDAAAKAPLPPPEPAPATTPLDLDDDSPALAGARFRARAGIATTTKPAVGFMPAPASAAGGSFLTKFWLTLIVLGVLGLGGYQWHSHSERAQIGKAEAANPYGFVPVLMPDGAPDNVVLVFAPDNCPKEGAQRAVRLLDALRDEKVPARLQTRYQLSVALQGPEDERRLRQLRGVMGGELPAVLIGGMGKANPTVEETVGEYRRQQAARGDPG